MLCTEWWWRVEGLESLPKTTSIASEHEEEVLEKFEKFLHEKPNDSIYLRLLPNDGSLLK